MKFLKWRPYLPILRLVIEIPLISIRTYIACESFESRTYEYIVLAISIWKWNFEIGLYDLDERIQRRNSFDSQ